MDARIQKIYTYAHKRDEEKRKKQEQLTKRRNELIKTIQYLNLDVADLIGTATACLTAGIEIDKYHRYDSLTYDTYEKGTFVANAISHRLGFIIEKNVVLGIGIRCCGTNCDIDLISEDYGNVYARSANRSYNYRKKSRQLTHSHPLLGGFS